MRKYYQKKIKGPGRPVGSESGPMLQKILSDPEIMANRDPFPPYRGHYTEKTLDVLESLQRGEFSLGSETKHSRFTKYLVAQY